MAQGHPSKHGANIEAVWSRPLWKNHHDNRVTGYRCPGTAARESFERWTRSVTYAASGPQPGVVLALTVHVPAIVLLCLLR
jgi:hypothetical protein